MRATARWRERKSVVNGKIKTLHSELIGLLEGSMSMQVRTEIRSSLDDSILWPVIMVTSPIRSRWREDAIDIF
jgi:hypothetical protein